MGALVAIPTIVSIVAPTAAQAATVVVVQFKVSNATCDPGGSVINPVCINNSCCTGGGGGYTFCRASPPGSPEPSECSTIECTFTDSSAVCNT